MTAHSRAVVEPGGVLRTMTSQPPLTLRRIHADAPDTCALCLVGSAAGPMEGDDLRLDLTVAPGARASLTASGASLALGRRGEHAALDVGIAVGAGGSLVGETGPLIVGAGARLDVGVTIELVGDATLTWSELVVLGRTGELGGAVRLTWNVTRDGRAVLRQSTDLTDRALRDWPGMTSGARVLATVLRMGPGVPARSRALSARVAAHRLADGAELLTVFADDTLSAARAVAALSADGERG